MSVNVSGGGLRSDDGGNSASSGPVPQVHFADQRGQPWRECEESGAGVEVEDAHADGEDAMSERQPLLRPQKTGRLLTAVDDDVESFDLMLLRATVFVEDACSLRSITHR